MSNNCCCGQQPILLSCYPYTRGAMYQCDCCTAMHQPTDASKYPASGQMQETAYMIKNTVPYLVDNFTTNYGTKLSVSENVYTRVTKRQDPSCINVVARFDMTEDSITTNTAYAAFLEQTISNQYTDLEGVLPILKSTVTFKIYFHVEDGMGGVVYENYMVSIAKDHLFHYTDVQDFFLTSFKNVVITNIPQLDFQGVYNIVFDRVEAYVDVIDTKLHVNDDLNPYYQFTNNNTKVVVQHDTIQAQAADSNILIASAEINTGFPVQLGLTTRVKVSYTAFMSGTIAVGNSFGVYNALNGTTERSIEQLTEEVTLLQEEVALLRTELERKPAIGTVYGHAINMKTGQIVYYMHDVEGIQYTDMYVVIADYVTKAAGEYDDLIAADVAEGKLSPVTGFQS